MRTQALISLSPLALPAAIAQSVTGKSMVLDLAYVFNHLSTTGKARHIALAMKGPFLICAF